MNADGDPAAIRADEREVREALAKGSEVDLYAHLDGQRRSIGAEVLRDVCTSAVPEGRAPDRVHIAGAQVKGRLDLAGAHLVGAIRFRDCVFEEEIDLRGARTAHPLEWAGGQTGAILADQFETTSNLAVRGVEVTGKVSLQWASVDGDLRFTGSHLAAPGPCAIDGADLRVGRTLFLDGPEFHAEGEVCLQSSHIGGDVDCRQGRFDNPSGYSINAAKIVVDGKFLCEQGFRSDGEVCLQWAQLSRLRATGGEFASRTPYALHADAMRALAGVYLDRGFNATAGLRLIGAAITGELCCTEGRFSGPNAPALNAERIVADHVYLDRGFTAHGEVRFTDAQVNHQFNATQGTFRNHRRRGYALNADGLKCGGEVYLNDGFQATGAVSLRGAEIASELNCTSGCFANPGDYALFADGLTTPGIVYLDKKFHARGQVRFARATVGRQFVASGGFFDNGGQDEKGIALDLTGLVTQGDVLFNHSGQPYDEPTAAGKVAPFRANGTLRMRDARISRDLDFSDSELDGVTELDARGMQVGGRLIWKMAKPVHGSIDLSMAVISRLDDDTLSSWPDHRYMLDGMTYRVATASSRETPDKPMPVAERIRWLDRTAAYSQTAYRQLAQSYRLSGDEASAEKILIACQRHQRTRGYPKPMASKRPEWLYKTTSKAWNFLLGLSVGYGYRLHRVFLFLLALGLIGWWLYKSNSQLIYPTQGSYHLAASEGCSTDYPCFNPFVYSFQLLVPALDLREIAFWLPSAATLSGKLLMAYTWAMIAIGWVAVTVVVAGITRVFRQR